MQGRGPEASSLVFYLVLCRRKEEELGQVLGMMLMVCERGITELMCMDSRIAASNFT